jgi:hypothetical protein
LKLECDELVYICAATCNLRRLHVAFNVAAAAAAAAAAADEGVPFVPTPAAFVSLGAPPPHPAPPPAEEPPEEVPKGKKSRGLHSSTAYTRPHFS